MTQSGRTHLQAWIPALQDQGGDLPPGCQDWRGECVEQAIKAAGTSAPGVDGVPYEAHKRSIAAAG
eukprot:11346330-Alexandrium_andersonii.AAC.1